MLCVGLWLEKKTLEDDHVSLNQEFKFFLDLTFCVKLVYHFILMWILCDICNCTSFEAISIHVLMHYLELLFFAIFGIGHYCLHYLTLRML